MTADFDLFDRKFFAVFARNPLVHGALAGDGESEELSEEKRADIESLIEISGGLNVGKQMLESYLAQMTQTLKLSRPDAPQGLFDSLQEEVKGVIEENLPTFKSLMVPIYHKHLNHGDIKGMIRFYQTELGQKIIRVTPLITKESLSVGQQWGQSLGPEIERRVSEILRN